MQDLQQQQQQQQQPYSVGPSVYPLSSSAADNQWLTPGDLSSLVTCIPRLCDERQRVQFELMRQSTELVTTHIAQLCHSTYAMQCQLSAMQQQQQQQQHEQRQRQPQPRSSITLLPDEADDDDVEEKELELQELRQWKRLFCAAETRSLVERVEELTARVRELEVQHARRCCCSSSRCRAGGIAESNATSSTSLRSHPSHSPPSPSPPTSLPNASSAGR